eukprot:TRINITY_DN4160_c1_g1_i1.p2 TRINITY_DN4160_c1_g1~~TRINITY_DN4160_c1_g1_i1.p2  ORF type:complete len:429 (-),score=25.42 TRINITY_DN4160_c1_g1_i1:962-2248(-)
MWMEFALIVSLAIHHVGSQTNFTKQVYFAVNGSQLSDGSMLTPPPLLNITINAPILPAQPTSPSSTAIVQKAAAITDNEAPIENYIDTRIHTNSIDIRVMDTMNDTADVVEVRFVSQYSPQIVQQSQPLTCSDYEDYALQKSVLQYFCSINQLQDLRKFSTEEMRTCCQVDEYILTKVNKIDQQNCICLEKMDSELGQLIDLWRVLCLSSQPECIVNTTKTGSAQVKQEGQQGGQQNQQNSGIDGIQPDQKVSGDVPQENMIDKLGLSVSSLQSALSNVTLLQAMERISSLKTAFELMHQLGLEHLLKNKFQPMTMFVPTNAAFEQFGLNRGYPVGTLATMDDIKEILEYHIVQGERVVGGIDDAHTFKTWQGGNLTIQSANPNTRQTYLYATGCCSIYNFAFIIVADATTEHGVLHIIDTVLQPPPI